MLKEVAARFSAPISGDLSDLMRELLGSVLSLKLTAKRKPRGCSARPRSDAAERLRTSLGLPSFVLLTSQTSSNSQGLHTSSWEAWIPYTVLSTALESLAVISASLDCHLQSEFLLCHFSKFHTGELFSSLPTWGGGWTIIGNRLTLGVPTLGSFGFLVSQWAMPRKLVPETNVSFVITFISPFLKTKLCR